MSNKVAWAAHISVTECMWIVGFVSQLMLLVWVPSFGHILCLVFSACVACFEWNWIFRRWLDIIAWSLWPSEFIVEIWKELFTLFWPRLGQIWSSRKSIWDHAWIGRTGLVLQLLYLLLIKALKFGGRCIVLRNLRASPFEALQQDLISINFCFAHIRNKDW